MVRNAKNRVLLLVPAALAGAVFAANVRGASITNGNSSLTINPSSSTLPFISNWVVDGVDQYGGSPAGEENFTFSIGSPGILAQLNNSLPVTGSSFNNGVGSVTYTASDYTVTVTDVLTGGSPGSGASAISETIAVSNTETPLAPGSSALQFNLGDYVNLNVNGTPNNDTLTLSPSTGTNTATQTDPSGAVVTFSTTPTPTVFQTVDPATRTPGTTLGPLMGDEAFEAGWSMSIDPGDSEIVSINETLTGGSTSVVPLPSSAGASLAMLAGLGAIGIVRRKRRAAM